MDEKRSVQISYAKQPVENWVALNIKKSFTIHSWLVNIITKGKKYASGVNTIVILHNSLKYSMYNFTYSGHAAIKTSWIHKQNAIIIWDTDE